MKSFNKYIALSLVVVLTACSKDYLERTPLDQMTDPEFWTNENNIRTYSYGFYTSYFDGYGSGFTWGSYFSGQALNDDFAPTSPSQFIQNVPTSGGGWAGITANLPFVRIRKANHFIESIPLAELETEANDHWVGVGRFFRGLAYADFVSSFGDVPWFDRVLLEDDEDLYRPRDPRTLVMDRVLEDFEFAAANIREQDGPAKMSVNRDLVLAYMSRVFLFEGTWLKYHEVDETRAKTYLEAAKWAANELISLGKYSVDTDYRGVFNSLDLSGNPEVIMYRRYEVGILTHALMSYNNLEPQSGISRNAVESYLAEDGLPISLSPLYQGDRTIEDVMDNRDGRMAGTMVPALRLLGIAGNHSTSGYSTHKFLNESIRTLPEGSGSLNPTDAPIIRYGEVLVNYAEACVELGTLTQDDLDKSVNVLRNRPGVNLPDLQVAGNSPMVNGVAYDDPVRDASVSSITWEIRRERRSELLFEGFRLNDLRRWKKMEYVDTQGNVTINRGAWINKADFPNNNLDNITLDRAGDEGYIVPAPNPASQRLFVDEKVYLNPLPIDQIALYNQNGSELTQNPGW